ncbi:MAG: ABC transporter ATP-binding protein [Clostridia bacterium]|nr:ABC transporter ATP-binding protein [Clostridia bacterium]
MAVILEIRNLSKSFGGLKAVNDVSLDIEEGKITSVIGPNGAGKTTVFNLVTGFLTPDAGTVRLAGKDITRLPAHRIAAEGLTRTFQLVRVFPRMTLTENIMMGYNDLEGDTLWSALASTKKMHRQYREKRDQAVEMVKYIGLEKYKDSPANDLSYGQQKLVEIGRALISRPKLILLDEPLAGLNVVMIKKMIDLINDMKRQGNTVVLIEHNMEIVMSISDIVHVLSAGGLLTSGVPEEILRHEKVIESYLGY